MPTPPMRRRTKPGCGSETGRSSMRRSLGPYNTHVFMAPFLSKCLGSGVPQGECGTPGVGVEEILFCLYCV